MKGPVLLDLFCGAGGASAGYHEAGFRVVGVDIEYQPSYRHQQITADVTKLDIGELAANFGAVAVHASPPCQRASRLRYYQPEVIEQRYPDLIASTREQLRATGLPYVIENVRGAALEDPHELCGCMFNGLMIYRPRRFEVNFEGIWWPKHNRHTDRCVRNGYLPTPERPRMSIHGGKHSAAWQRKAADVMGVTWMKTVREVCESIPPAYTRHIGLHLIQQFAERAA